MEGYGLVRPERGERGRIMPKVLHDRVALGPAVDAVAQSTLTEGCRVERRHAMPLAMNAAKLLARIAPEAGKMGGKPVIRGRRITPAMVLNMLANGASREAVLEAYPVLEPEDIDACLLYAARLSEVAAAEGLTIAAE